MPAETTSASGAPGPAGLSAAVTEVLAAIPDRAFRERLRRVLAASASAIARLRLIDFSHAEELAGAEDTSDLVLWEEMAPAVAAFLADVNGLLRAVEEQFPSSQAAALEDDLDLAFGPADGSTAAPTVDVLATPAEKMRAAEGLVQAVAEGLKREVSRFGARVRKPSVVADRWNLLVDLQELRGRCRSAMGELVYQSCAIFAEVSRPSIIPDHAVDLADALAVRRAWAGLSRIVGPLNARLQAAPPEEERALVGAIDEELKQFCSTRGYLAMRAADKRSAVVFVRDLRACATADRLGPATRRLVEGFAKFLDSLAAINRREILVNHDQEAVAACGVLVEQARTHLTAEPPRARDLLAQAMTTAQTLFGRDRALDDFLERRQRWPLDEVIDSALGQVVDEFIEWVAAVGGRGATAAF